VRHACGAPGSIHRRVAKAGLKVEEVPSFERGRCFRASNLYAYSDGMRVLRTIQAEADPWHPWRSGVIVGLRSCR
jgi:hypothetical protein